MFTKLAGLKFTIIIRILFKASDPAFRTFVLWKYLVLYFKYFLSFLECNSCLTANTAGKKIFRLLLSLLLKSTENIYFPLKWLLKAIPFLNRQENYVSKCQSLFIAQPCYLLLKRLYMTWVMRRVKQNVYLITLEEELATGQGTVKILDRELRTRAGEISWEI